MELVKTDIYTEEVAPSGDENYYNNHDDDEYDKDNDNGDDTVDEDSEFSNDELSFDDFLKMILMDSLASEGFGLYLSIFLKTWATMRNQKSSQRA